MPKPTLALGACTSESAWAVHFFWKIVFNTEYFPVWVCSKDPQTTCTRTITSWGGKVETGSQRPPQLPLHVQIGSESTQVCALQTPLSDFYSHYKKRIKKKWGQIYQWRTAHCFSFSPSSNTTRSTATV